MKKAIALLILFTMTVSILTGCSSNNANPTPDSGFSSESDQKPGTGSDPESDKRPGTGSDPESDKRPGTGSDPNPASDLDAATIVKLLLAEERLNTALLKNNGNIFEEGVKVMSDLADKAIDSVSYASDYRVETATVTSLDATDTDSRVIFDNNIGGGLVTFDGEKYLFGDFVEVSNSCDTFWQTANYIATMAEDAAAMIDNIKKNVRIVDKWVSVAGFEFYLHVGENEEILYQRHGSQYKICKRYINEDGNNVYEFLMHEKTNGYTDKLLYIPGLRFETVRGECVDGVFGYTDYLICDNAKGYWETYWTSAYPTHVNVSYMVMKDDICYDSFYDPARKVVQFLKIMSADKTSDIFWYQASETEEKVVFNVHFSGFNNITGISTDSISMIDMGGELGTIPHPNENESMTLLLANGKTVKVGDTFLDGKVEVISMTAHMIYPNYIGMLSVYITAPTVEEKLEIFKEFLNELGLTSRHDLDSVISGVVRAFAELRETTKYHVWNGLNQADEENIRRAMAIENEKTLEFMKLYHEIENAPVVDFNDKETVELNAHFADVVVDAHQNTVQSGLGISIDSLTLSVSDTLLFIKDQPYTVGFALASDAGLIHLQKKTESDTASFDGGDGFSVTVRDVALDIPVLIDGEYKLVAYIATDDGVRSSAYTVFEIDTVDTASEISVEKTKLTASKGADGGLVLSYITVIDVYTELTHEGVLDYTGLYTLMAGIACEHGIPSGTEIEMLGDSENALYTAMTGSETEITDGVYRLAYNMENGEKRINGFIYVTLTVIPETDEGTDKPEDNTGVKPEDNTEDKPTDNTEDKPADNTEDKPADNAEVKTEEDKPKDNTVDQG